MPGGSPECGGSVTIYLKGDGNGEVEALSWTGQGDTISMGATSIVVERILREGLSIDDVLEMDYEEIIDSVGRDIIGNRTRHATLGLSTIKAAIRQYQQDRTARTSPLDLATYIRRPTGQQTRSRSIIGPGSRRFSRRE